MRLPLHVDLGAVTLKVTLHDIQIAALFGAMSGSYPQIVPPGGLFLQRLKDARSAIQITLNRRTSSASIFTPDEKLVLRERIALVRYLQMEAVRVLESPAGDAPDDIVNRKLMQGALVRFQEVIDDLPTYALKQLRTGFIPECPLSAAEIEQITRCNFHVDPRLEKWRMYLPFFQDRGTGAMVTKK